MSWHSGLRRVAWGVLVLLTAWGSDREAVAQREAEGLSASIRKAADRVAPSVVGIRPLDVFGPIFPGGPVPGPIGPGGIVPGMPSRPVEAGRGPSGSGVVVDAARGLILTVEPVVQGASRVAVVLADGREIASERVARDPRSELVLLTVDPKAAPFQPVDWAEAEALHEGDWVISVGRAGGTARTLSVGIVSALGPGGRGETELLTDALITLATSGGPLVNLDGKVVGIAIARADLPGRPREFGHAVPASVARKIASDLADLGRVRRGYLGLRIDREETADPRSGSGRLFIAGVMPGGPAAEAGFQMGDRIEALDGRPVADVEAFSRAIMDAPVGQEFTVTIERGGVTREIRVKSRQLPGPGSVPADSRPVRPGTPRRALPRDRARGEWPRQAPAPPAPSAPLRSEPSDVGPSPARRR